MRFETSSSFICGILELGSKQWEVKSFVFIPLTKSYTEYQGYVRKLDDNHFININYNNGKTKFTVYRVSDGITTTVSEYISPTNCFSDRIVYTLTNKYILSGLNDTIVVDRTTYSINHLMYPVNNPYCEIVPVKYKVNENYNIEYLVFTKKEDSSYRVTVTDSFLTRKENSITYNDVTFNTQPITEQNLPLLTSYNEKNLYGFKSGGKYYIQVEVPDTVSRTTRFRDTNFGNLSRRYKYNIVEFDTSTQKFRTLYTSSDNIIYYIHQKDYTQPTYLYTIRRNSNSYQVTVTTLEDSTTISTTDVPIESNFQLVAVTHVRDEIVIVEGRDVVKDDFTGIEILITNLYLDNSNTIVVNQSKHPINLFCVKPGNEDKTVGLDLKGITFYDSEITFAVYCGSKRYDMNFVTVNIVSNNVFTVTSKRQPFTYSFINHPVVKIDDGYVKTGLVKSRYNLHYPQTSVVYSVGGDLNDLRRVDINLTSVYFSKYRQSLKKVDTTVFVGDLSIGYDYREKKYVIPLQEPTDSNVSSFKDFIQSYCVTYSPELLKHIYILKRATRYPTNVVTKGINSRLVDLYKFPIITLQMCNTGFDILYFIGLKYEYCDVVNGATYSNGVVNLDTDNLRIYATNTQFLQDEFVRELPLESFKAYGSPIFTSKEQFFGMYNIDDSSIAVLKQINPNSGIPYTQDGSSQCFYRYEFEIYYGLEHSNLEYYGTVEYTSQTPVQLLKYDSSTSIITYTQPIIFTTESSDKSYNNEYDLYLYFFTNKLSLSGTWWYTFEEIYGSF